MAFAAHQECRDAEGVLGNAEMPKGFLRMLRDRRGPWECRGTEEAPENAEQPETEEAPENASPFLTDLAASRYSWGL